MSCIPAVILEKLLLPIILSVVNNLKLIFMLVHLCCKPSFYCADYKINVPLKSFKNILSKIPRDVQNSKLKRSVHMTSSGKNGLNIQGRRRRGGGQRGHVPPPTIKSGGHKWVLAPPPLLDRPSVLIFLFFHIL